MIDRMPRTPTQKRPNGNGQATLRPPNPTTAARLDALEVAMALMQKTLDHQFNRISAMQALLDHMIARQK